jgi:trigger factor
MYGPDVFWNDAVGFLIDDYFRKSLEAEGLKSYCEPDFEVEAISDTELKFKATVQGRPEVKLGKYKGIKIKRMDTDVKVEDVDAELKKAAEKVASWDVPAKKRAAKNGDKCTIDFSGSVDGVKFEGGTAEMYDLTLGSGTFIPGFEEQVAGMKLGEERDVKVKFPANYGKEELADKDAVFAVKLHEIKERKLPELNDEFAKDVSEFNTLDEYRQSISAKLSESKVKEANYKAVDELLDTIVKNATVKVPEQMVLDRAERMLIDFEKRLTMQGMKMEMYYQYAGTTKEQMFEQYKPRAEEACRANLVFEVIMETEKMDNDGGEKLLEWLKNENGLGDIKEQAE